MKKLISILNSLMIVGSSTVVTVACNKLKSLDPEGNDKQKKHHPKDVT